MNRILSQAKEKNCLIAIGPLKYDPVTQHLYAGDKQIELEPRSAELLDVLLDHVGAPLSADEIIESVWQSKFISRNVLTNRISTLRAIFKQYAPDMDASRVLITYPKKGYFFNQDKVRLLEPPELPVTTEKPKTKATAKKPFWFAAVGLIALAAIIGFYSFHQQAKQEQHQNTQVPVVELLLNRIKAADPHSRKYLRSIKMLMLSEQVKHPYTSLVNQDAPSYFLAPIDNSRYWPGATNILSSDYKLDMDLSSSQEDQSLMAVVKLKHYKSEKRVYQAEYVLNPDSLEADVHALNQDLVDFFKLPECEDQSNNSLRTEELVNMTVGQAMDQAIIRGQVNEVEAGFISRALLSSKDINQEKLKAFLNVVENSFRYHSEETGIWLGLLYYRMEDFDTAHEYLVKTHFNSQVDNAFLYLVLSDIALEQKQADDFRINYLKSMVALTRTVPSEQIFKRLSQSENRDTCLEPWEQMVKDAKVQEQLSPWLNRFTGYCQQAGDYLK